MLAQEDQRVGERLEPVHHPRREILARLAVVVVHERDRRQRVFLDQRAVEDAAQVVVAGRLGRVAEIEVERGVEEACRAAGVLQSGVQLVNVAGPILADGEQFLVGVFAAEVAEPVFDEAGGDVLDRVEAEPAGYMLSRPTALPVRGTGSPSAPTAPACS